MGGPGAVPAPSDPGQADPPRPSDADGPTLRVVHGVGTDMAAALPATPPAGTRLLIVAAPVGTVLPHEAGRMGGRVLHLSYLPPQPSAFRVLADCARILPRLDDAVGAGLSYALAGHAEAAPDRCADVVWQAGPDGCVTAFRLSAAAMGDPLLAATTEELVGAPLTDDRRFAFLAVALTGG